MFHSTSAVPQMPPAVREIFRFTKNISIPSTVAVAEEEEFEPKKAKKQKGSRGPGFFSKIKEKMINMFDEEIDDNEI